MAVGCGVGAGGVGGIRVGSGMIGSVGRTRVGLGVGIGVGRVIAGSARGGGRDSASASGSASGVADGLGLTVIVTVTARSAWLVPSNGR